jgi:hypothetical protein
VLYSEINGSRDDGSIRRFQRRARFVFLSL